MTAELLATCSGGIIFTGESVRAIRGGRKTQTRRVLKQATVHGEPALSVHPDGAGTGWIAWWGSRAMTAEETARLYPGAEGFRLRYQPGKRYYVKETWTTDVHEGGYFYRVDAPDLRLVDGDEFGIYRKDGTEASPWRSPMHMPRSAARYVVEVDSVRVQRLQDITEEDARAEGVDGCAGGHGPVSRDELRHEPGYWHQRFYREGFEWAWSMLHDKPTKWGKSWASNPWVAAYFFHLVKP